MMPRARPSKIIFTLLPLVLFYAAFDSGSHKDLPKLGLSVLFMVFAILILTVEERKKIPPPMALLPFGGFVLFSTMTLLWSMSPTRTANEAAYLGGMLGAFIVGANINDKHKILRWLGLIALVIVTIGFYFFLLPNLGIMSRSHDMQNYFFSTFYWKNPAAAFISIFIPLTLYLLSTSMKKAEKILWSVSLCLHIAAFILTRSRGAWLAFLISLVLIVIFVLHRRKNYDGLFRSIGNVKFFLIASLTLGITLGILLLPQNIKRQSIETVSEIENGNVIEKEERSSFERKAMLKLGWDVFLDKPMGTGAGAFIAAYPSYLRNDIYLSKHLHNQYLHYLVETGFIGFLLYISFMFFIVLYLLKGRDNLSPFVLLSFMAFSLHLLLDFHWTFGGITMPLMVLVGMTTNSYSPQKRITIPLFILFIFLSILAIMSATSIAFRDNALVDEKNYARWMERSIKVFPLSAESRYYLALYYQSNSEHARAEELYESALSLEGNSSSIHNAFGSFLVDMGDTVQGLKHMRQSIEYAPFSSTNSYRKVGDILMAQKKEEQALAIWQTMIENFSRNPQEEYTSNSYTHRYDVGYALRQIGNYFKKETENKKAESFFKEAERMELPRRHDALAEKIGIETHTPEYIAYQLVKSSLENEGYAIENIGISRAGYDLLNGRARVEIFYVIQTDTLTSRSVNIRTELREGKWQIIGGNPGDIPRSL